MKEPATRLDYCQYLLVSQINYTLTNFAEHSKRFSHDQIDRYLSGEKIIPRLYFVKKLPVFPIIAINHQTGLKAFRSKGFSAIYF